MVGENIDNDLKKIKNIKLIAKWFLAAQTLFIIWWGIAAYSLMEYIFTAAGFMGAFAIILIYIIVFWILTLSVVLGSVGSFSIKISTMKLKAVFLSVLIPVLIMILLILKTYIK